MKLAFTSCMNISQRPEQPVWEKISQEKPDYLLLLGDSIYADVPWPQVLGQDTSIEELKDNQLVIHLHRLYQQQLAEPRFAALIRQVPTFAIWDDHDFLGNNSRGGNLSPALNAHVRATRAVFNAYCRALTAQDPLRFPALPNAQELWRAGEPAPGYQHRVLSEKIHLHLTDSRSDKTFHHLLGQAQREAMAQNVLAHPDAVHLVATSIVFENTFLKESWGKFRVEQQWLKELARQTRIVLLAGDIHRNQHARHPLGAGRVLHEFIASGAAISPPLRWPGWPTHNFGVIDFQEDALEARLFSNLAPPPPSIRLPYSQL